MSLRIALCCILLLGAYSAAVLCTDVVWVRIQVSVFIVLSLFWLQVSLALTPPVWSAREWMICICSVIVSIVYTTWYLLEVPSGLLLAAAHITYSIIIYGIPAIVLCTCRSVSESYRTGAFLGICDILYRAYALSISAMFYFGSRS